jgi:hypothetical protein
MLDFLEWQVMLGIYIVGFIMGFASAIGLAQWLMHRRNMRDEDEG